MCGIVGFYKHPQASLAVAKHLPNYFKQGIIVDMLRGMGGTGVMAIEPDVNPTVRVVKRGLCGLDFLHSRVWQTYGEDCMDRTFVVGHNRAATIGDISDNNSHPFHEDPITLIHNGTIQSLWNVRQKLDVDRFDIPRQPVDSHIACMTMAQMGIKEGIQELIDIGSGSFTFVIHSLEEPDRIFVARNDQRPFWYSHLYHNRAVYDDKDVTKITSHEKEYVGMCFGSEPKMVDWLIDRNIWGAVYSEPKEISDMTLFSLKAGNKSFTNLHTFKKAPTKIVYSTKAHKEKGGHHAPFVNGQQLERLPSGGSFERAVVKQWPKWVNKVLYRKVENNWAMSTQLRDWVVFQSAGWETRAGNSRHGTLYGESCMHEESGFTSGFCCIAHGIEKDSLIKDGTGMWVGQIIRMWEVTSPEIAGERVMMFQLKDAQPVDPLELGVDASEEDILDWLLENNYYEEYEQTEDEPDGNTESNEGLTVDGPYGGQISTHARDALTADGCAHCGQPFDPASDVIWLWGQPVHLNCSLEQVNAGGNLDA
jgi:hypothetical protein